MFFKSLYLTYILNYKKIALKVFLKKHRDVSKAIVTSNVELFVTLLSGFQRLINFTKNSILGSTGVLNPPLEYKTVEQLMNYSTYSSDCILYLKPYN